MKKTQRLDLFMNGIRVGTLERRSDGALFFAYAKSWLEREQAMPISRRFPLGKKPLSGPAIQAYFDNLLPDDRRVRERVAARAQAGGTQAFDILAAVGHDCIGALQFYPEGQAPGPVRAPAGQPVSEREIAELVRNLRINPLGIDRERDFRISLAGAQSKTALLRMGDQWLLPEGATPTTHILKPAIGAVSEGPDLSLSVENEWLCLRLLRAYGLDVAEAGIARFEDLPVLSVERFDRSWSHEKLYRLPQEDVCQALGVGPETKYESDGGPGIGEVLSLLNESDERDQDRQTFMKAQLIFWLMAAIDGHAKNFSVFIRPGGFALTPIYDVLSALPHVNPKSLPMQKLKLAMSVGTKHYRVGEILSRHWIQSAATHKFAGIEALMAEVAGATARAIARVSAELPRDFPSKVSDRIFEGMTERAEKLARGA